MRAALLALLLLAAAGCTLLVGERRSDRDGGALDDLGVADLTGADLTGADLAGADLAGVDLFGVDLAGAVTPPCTLVAKSAATEGVHAVSNGDAPDIAATGGSFTIAFSHGGSTWAIGLNDSGVVHTATNVGGTCSPNCSHPHVARSGAAAETHFSMFGSNNYIAVRAAADYSGSTSQATACTAAYVGNDVTTDANDSASVGCGGGAATWVAVSATAGSAPTTITAPEMRVASDAAGNASYTAILRTTSIDVAPFATSSATIGTPAQLTFNLTNPVGLGFDVLDGAPPIYMAAVKHMSGLAWVVGADQAGAHTASGGDVVASAQAPVGVAAGPGVFLLAWGDSINQVHLVAVDTAGNVGNAIIVSKVGANGSAPAVAWDAASARVGVAWLEQSNPDPTYLHFASYACQ